MKVTNFEISKMTKNKSLPKNQIYHIHLPEKQKKTVVDLANNYFEGDNVQLDMDSLEQLLLDIEIVPNVYTVKMSKDEKGLQLLINCMKEVKVDEIIFLTSYEIENKMYLESKFY